MKTASQLRREIFLKCFSLAVIALRILAIIVATFSAGYWAYQGDMLKVAISLQLLILLRLDAQ